MRDDSSVVGHLQCTLQRYSLFLFHGGTIIHRVSGQEDAKTCKINKHKKYCGYPLQGHMQEFEKRFLLQLSDCYIRVNL